MCFHRSLLIFITQQYYRRTLKNLRKKSLFCQGLNKIQNSIQVTNISRDYSFLIWCIISFSSEHSYFISLSSLKRKLSATDYNFNQGKPFKYVHIYCFNSLILIAFFLILANYVFIYAMFFSPHFQFSKLLKLLLTFIQRKTFFKIYNFSIFNSHTFCYCEPHLAMLRSCCWLCTQELLLEKTILGV